AVAQAASAGVATGVSAAGRTPFALSDEEIGRWIGHAGSDVWEVIAPGIDEETKKAYFALAGADMKRLVLAGKARLYPHALEALTELKAAGHTLVFLSNCNRDYMETHREYFGLTEYFSGFYNAEDYGYAPKHRIFPFIAKAFPEENPRHYIVIGDRHCDIAVATTHGLKSIGCTYGYGKPEELEEATALCNSAATLPQRVEELLQRM
ncbi:MAG TPA: hypothetical protein DEB24_03175, partial [Coriobacteriia bacterium]|nr:hypothetical protein [Coriobacteriia bacterium]